MSSVSPHVNYAQPNVTNKGLCIHRMDSKIETKEYGLRTTLVSIWSALRLGISYTVNDVCRRPRNCCIGMITVVLVILFTGAVMTTVAKAPYIIMRLSELGVSEMDVVLKGGLKGEATVNHTEIQLRLINVTCVRGVTPRWIAQVSSQNSQAPDVPGKNKKLSTRANLLIIDGDTEEEIGLGRAWSHRVTGYSEAHVHESILTLTQVRPNRGERLRVSIPLDLLLPTVGIKKSIRLIDLKKFMNLSNAPNSKVFDVLKYLIAPYIYNYTLGPNVSIENIVKTSFGVNVVDGISAPMGKYPSLFGNIIVLDYRQLVPAILDSSCIYGQQLITPIAGVNHSALNADNEKKRYLSQVDIRSHAMFLAIVLQSRRSVYGTQDRTSALVQCSNEMMRAIGIDYGGEVLFPIARAFEKYENMAAILSSTLIRTVVEIAVLGGIVLFALLQVNADERQYEVALMRTQGFEKNRLLVLIVFQTLVFIIPGISIGIGLVVILHVSMEHGLAAFTHAPAQPLDIPLLPILLASVLGVVLPTIATWLPVSRALGDSLHDAMNIYRQAQVEAKVVMIKLEDIGLALWEVLLGVFLTVFGFIVYYMIPFAFIFQEVQLFFVLLNVILFVLILGLCMVMYTLEPYAETFFVWLMLWRSEKRLQTLIKKNLEDHRTQNSKAFMMFLLSVTGVVASGVILEILSQSAQQMLELSGGADIAIHSKSFRVPLNDKALNAVLEKWRGDGVEEWAYRGFPLSRYPQITTSTHISSAIGVGKRMSIVSVSKNFLRTVYPDVVNEAALDDRHEYETTSNGVTDVVGSMYKNPPIPVLRNKVTDVTTGFPLDREKPKVYKKMSVIVPAIGAVSLQDYLGVDVGSGLFLSYKYKLKDGTVKTTFYMQIRALMKSMSGFPEMQSSPMIRQTGTIVLPETAFKELLDPTTLDFGKGKNVEITGAAIKKIVYEVLYVRLQKGLSARDRTLLINSLETKSDGKKHVFVDTQMELREVEVVSDFIKYLFYFNSFVCVSLCTLLMWVTFSANVQLNAWSIGVLRSIGFCESQIIRSTLYEAFSVVFSAFVLGTLVGIVVGTTVGLQLSSVFALPFQLPLPFPLIGVLWGLVVISALAGSILPYRVLRRKKISHILKGL